MYHQLGAGAPSDRLALRATLDVAVSAKKPRLVVGLDRIAELDSATINSLIVALRRMRDAGGEIRLHVTRRDILRTLADTGLDHVFQIVDTPGEDVVSDGAAHKKVPTLGSRPKRTVADGIAGLLAALLVLAGSTLAALAQGNVVTEQLTPEQVIAKVVERNPELHSFQAHVDVRLHTGIPFLNPTLEGTTYFKRPDNYEVVFTKVPSYAHGIDKLYSDIGDPSSWEKRFIITSDREQVYNGHRDIVLRLVQRVRGMIDHEDVFIDPQAWTVERLTYRYYNGGEISLEQTFRDEGGFNVLSDQRAVIALPNLPRTIGSAHYSNYHINVAIDDAVFTMKQTKDLGTK